MTGPHRRQQMLLAAGEIVRERGVHVLTLARLAQVCGVTKPIAYQHFGSREHLLAALYEQLGADHEAAAFAALDVDRPDRPDAATTARTLSTAYVDCVLESGQLYAAISAALRASGADQTVRISFAHRYAAALSKFIHADDQSVFGYTVAFLGAGEHLCEAVVKGDLSRTRAIATLEEMLLAAHRAHR